MTDLEISSHIYTQKKVELLKQTVHSSKVFGECSAGLGFPGHSLTPKVYTFLQIVKLLGDCWIKYLLYVCMYVAILFYKDA